MLVQQSLQIVTGKKISPVGSNTEVGNLPKTGAIISQVDFGQQANDNYSPYGLAKANNPVHKWVVASQKMNFDVPTVLIPQL